MTFNQSTDATTESYFTVDIFPEVYLETDNTGSQCRSLIREVANDGLDGFALGTPFFRNVSITLNFLEETIEVFTKTVDSPLAYKQTYPDFDESLTYVIPQVIEATDAQYTGEFLVGTPSQGDGKKFAYSTNSYYSVIPSTSVEDGWFDT